MGKGGSSTNVEIPDYIENAARNNLARADFVSKLGPIPMSFGPTVAAFTPMEMSVFDNTARAADAFGLGAPTGTDVFGGMGQPTTYADGIRAFSAAPLFNQTMDEFALARPGQFNAINSMFIDPFGYNPAGTFDMGELVDINSTPVIDDTTTTTTTSNGGGSSSGGGGGASSTTTNNDFGNVGGTGFTTYGGSQDVANQAVVDAFADFGQQVSDAVATGGTVNVEDNPAFNAGIKAANENEIVTYLTNDNQIVSKKKGDLTSADFNNAAKIVDQNRLAADSMLAAGIRNVGGGFAQDDPTTGLLGSLTDTKNFITSEIKEVLPKKKKKKKFDFGKGKTSLNKSEKSKLDARKKGATGYTGGR